MLTVVDPADYQPVVDALKDHKDDADFRKHLAAKVFRHTAAYDALISNYLTEEEFPEKLTLTYEKQQALRYGENSHQKPRFTVRHYHPNYQLFPTNFTVRNYHITTLRMLMLH